MQTVESLIQALQSFPPDARCYVYEGESVTREDGKRVHSYLVITKAERTIYPNGGRSRPTLGYVPCEDSDDLDGPAVREG